MRKLPNWLTRREDGTMVVDPDLAYPAILTALKVPDGGADQYWIETAYQCAKMAVQELVEDTEFDPRPKGRALAIHITADGKRKDRWALSQYKPGKGAAAATKGLDAKRHYMAIRRTLLAA